LERTDISLNGLWCRPSSLRCTRPAPWLTTVFNCFGCLNARTEVQEDIIDTFPSGRRAGKLALTKNLNGKRILVVDRDPYMIAALLGLLKGTDATLRAASDGIEAIEEAAEFDPHLVILEARLPKRSGFLVLEHLKRSCHEGDHEPFVIMLSDVKGERHWEWAMTLGAADYLLKPVQMNRLRLRVEELLGT
jgi:PleD family two-component response regulator